MFTVEGLTRGPLRYEWGSGGTKRLAKHPGAGNSRELLPTPQSEGQGWRRLTYLKEPRLRLQLQVRTAVKRCGIRGIRGTVRLEPSRKGASFSDGFSLLFIGLLLAKPEQKQRRYTPSKNMMRP